MGSRELAKPEWQSFCDRLSKALLGHYSVTETASLVVNHEVVAEWVPLLGSAYDPKKDHLEITLRDLDHRVRQPERSISMKGLAGAGFEIIDAAGLRHSLALSQPLRVTLGLQGKHRRCSSTAPVAHPDRARVLGGRPIASFCVT
jgi:hypothetical protein